MRPPLRQASRLAALFFFAMTVLYGQALGQAARPFRSALTILKVELAYDIQADGTYVYEEFESIRLNNEQGVKARGQIPLSYSASLQELDVLEAYTQTPDGRRIDVPPDKIMLQQSAQSAGAPMFSDIKVKTVVFGGAEVGAVVNLRWRRTQKIAPFPGAFSMLHAFPASFDVRDAQLTLKAPASLKLYVDVEGLQGGEVPSDQADRQTWRWTPPQSTAMQAAEIGSLSPYDYSPRIAVTTFVDYAAAGKAYDERARPQAVVSPAIQKLADQITQGLDDRRSQSVALYNWVSRNIRYVAIFLGVGGVVPHSAEAVAEARYGDCKDHVTLLEALLAAKGIKSQAVLVNLGNAYALPKVAVTPGLFNHVITYLPEFDVFVDSTAAVAPFGILPFEERGKPALITDAAGGSRVVTLPATDPRRDTVQVETRMSIDSEGTVEGSSRVNQSGVFEVVARLLTARIPRGLEAATASRMLSLSGQTGTGTYAFADAGDLSKPFAFTSRFSLPNQVQLPGPGAFSVPLGLGSFSGIQSAFEITSSLPTRRWPIAVPSGRREETTTLTLADGVTVSALPKGLVIESPVGRYESSYVQAGAVITVKRVLDISLDGPLADPERYRQLRAMGLQVVRDLKSQIVYQ